MNDKVKKFFNETVALKFVIDFIVDYNFDENYHVTNEKEWRFSIKLIPTITIEKLSDCNVIALEFLVFSLHLWIGHKKNALKDLI